MVKHQALEISGNLPSGLSEILLERYREPHRRYHNVSHLAAVLAALEVLGADSDNQAVRLAAWFHDAVYDPQRADNEEISASLAQGLLPLFDFPSTIINEVARLVRLTATHRVQPDDSNGALLCDADLSVLAGDADSYSSYAAGVRAEYSFVGDADFARERAALLNALLDSEHVFHTPKGQELWEARARANISIELKLLAS